MPDYVSTKVYDSCNNVHAVAEVIAENIETVVVVNWKGSMEEIVFDPVK